MRKLGLLCAALLLTGAACQTSRESGSAIRNAGDEAANATAEAGRQLARVVDDATITSAVKMKFVQDETVRAFNIDVDTKDGNVTLTGTVDSQAEADRALELARGVEDVKNVTSHLNVKTTK